MGSMAFIRAPHKLGILSEGPHGEDYSTYTVLYVGVPSSLKLPYDN